MSSGTGVFTQTHVPTTDATADAHKITLSAGGTGETGALRGLVISQADTATTGVYDTLAYIENLKTPETTTNGLLITNTAGTLTSAIVIDGTAPASFILSSASLDISGAGAISGATGLASTGTIAFSGAGTFSIDSSAFDVSTAGALSRITTIGLSGQLTSTLASGTAPFVVTSNTL